MKSIFITESEGFFGSTLVEFFLKKNYRLKALVQYNPFQSAGSLDHLSEDEKKVSIIFGDIRDKEFLEKYIKNNDI
jgi:dTDP-glucose 4,6-dehydratase